MGSGVLLEVADQAGKHIVAQAPSAQTPSLPATPGLLQRAAALASIAGPWCSEGSVPGPLAAKEGLRRDKWRLPVLLTLVVGAAKRFSATRSLLPPPATASRRCYKTRSLMLQCPPPRVAVAADEGRSCRQRSRATASDWSVSVTVAASQGTLLQTH
jgi:hypothetical protein